HHEVEKLVAAHRHLQIHPGPHEVGRRADLQGVVYFVDQRNDHATDGDFRAVLEPEAEAAPGIGVVFAAHAALAEDAKTVNEIAAAAGITHGRHEERGG